MAGPRSGASYAVHAEAMDAGGAHAASASYSNYGSAGGIAGLSAAASPAETARQGYIGQLYDVTALQLAAVPATVNETAVRQLTGAQLLDDMTTLAVPAAGITWSILNGPLSIDVNGVAVASTVYQNVTATAQGVFAGNTGTLDITVLDTIADNFSTYAVDGLNDLWQVQYFGLSNPNAAPLADMDKDGLINLMEFAFGLNPSHGGSLQLPAAQRVGGDFVISFPTPPGVSGITYGAEWSTTLMPAGWQPLVDTGTPPQHTFRVPIGSNTQIFTRLKVTVP